MIFAESVVDFEHDGAIYPPVTLPDASSYVWAAHHYDVVTLMSKRFRPWITIDLTSTYKLPSLGSRGVAKTFKRMLAHVRGMGAKVGPRGIPTLVGECGVPFDMDHKKAFTGNFDMPIRALEANMVRSLLPPAGCSLDTQ